MENIPTLRLIHKFRFPSLATLKTWEGITVIYFLNYTKFLLWLLKCLSLKILVLTSIKKKTLGLLPPIYSVSQISNGKGIIKSFL